MTPPSLSPSDRSGQAGVPGLEAAFLRSGSYVVLGATAAVAASWLVRLDRHWRRSWKSCNLATAARSLSTGETRLDQGRIFCFENWVQRCRTIKLCMTICVRLPYQVAGKTYRIRSKQLYQDGVAESKGRADRIATVFRVNAKYEEVRTTVAERKHCVFMQRMLDT